MEHKGQEMEAGEMNSYDQEVEGEVERSNDYAER